MAELCEICLTPLRLWDDYTTIDHDNDSMLCLKCQEEVEELYDKSDGEKEFEKCVEEIRKKKKSEGIHEK